jgi:hypothetical protein
MELTVQQIVDQLAEHLGRPAILEDRLLQLITYSSHEQPVDGVRQASILRRHASPEVERWLEAFGLPQARRPIRVPGSSELGMWPRVCIPVLHGEVLLGYLWFIDADESMDNDDIALCVSRAAGLATQLHRDSLASHFSAVRVSDAMQALLTESPIAAEAARSLEDDGYICAADGIVAVVLRGVGDGSVDLADRLSRALVDTRRIGGQSESLHLVRKDHCILLLASATDVGMPLRERVEAVRDSVRSQLAAGSHAASLVVGVGGHRARLDEALESYREARMAVDAAMALPGMGDLVYWARLGVDQIVVKLAAMGVQPPVVHVGLRRLLDAPETLPLVETLETYLDVAGNAQVTAERLNLHRTSLYYRLQRVEQLAGTDLKDGQERLALHMALKVARMTGQYVPRHPNGRQPGRQFTPPRRVADLPRRPLSRPSPRLTLVPGAAHELAGSLP